jgi:hypothetical protein
MLLAAISKNVKVFSFFKLVKQSIAKVLFIWIKTRAFPYFQHLRDFEIHKEKKALITESWL